MSTNGSAILLGFTSNLLLNAIFMSSVYLGCSSAWPHSNHWYLLVGMGIASLAGVFVTSGHISNNFYRFGKFLAWLVTANVWTMMAITTKGPIIPTVTICWALGIVILVSIIGLVLYSAMTAARRSYY